MSRKRADEIIFHRVIQINFCRIKMLLLPTSSFTILLPLSLEEFFLNENILEIFFLKEDILEILSKNL